MFIHRIKKTNKKAKKVYISYLLRKTYRENGKVKTKTIANLSDWPKELIENFERLLKGGKIVDINDKKYFSYEQGKNYGGLKVILEVCKEIGLTEIIPEVEIKKKIIFLLSGLILSRVKSKNYIANKWKSSQAIEEVLGIKKYINEDSLYEILKYLSSNQIKIEQKLFKRLSQRPKEIFMYDITSSYVEGKEIELSEYGYNRDKKKGKKQIVIGLLTDKEGTPVSIEVFKGSTRDFATVNKQLRKLKENLGVKEVVFVGDRGMIKNAQIDEITSEKWKYITSITKPEIEKLLKEEIFEMSLFDEKLCEIEYKNIRYILRKNPFREAEINQLLKEKILYLQEKINKKNRYLSKHKKSSLEVAYRNIEEIQKKLKLQKILIIEKDTPTKTIKLKINKEEQKKYLKLSGCYVIKTNIKTEKLNKEQVHERYKYLSKVERNFRDLKTNFLEIRPIFVRKEKQVRGHVFACMLALRIIRYVESKIKDLNIDIRYAFDLLDSVQYTIVNYEGRQIKKLPDKLRPEINNMLECLKIKFASYL